jgi:hypothetical protein
MDEDCNFLVRAFIDKEQIIFCELVFAERGKLRGYRRMIEHYRDSPCERTNHEDCYYYKRKVERLDEFEK